MLRKALGLAASLASAALCAPNPAGAAFLYSVVQSGPDVLVTGSGSANTAGLLELFVAGCPSSGVNASTSYFGAGTGLCTAYGFITGPALGSGPATFASSVSGDAFQLAPAQSRLFLPLEYVSGSTLSNSMTFANQTYATLGLTPGDYTYTWGSGPTADQATIRIAPTPIPEPATPALLATALLALIILRRRAPQPLPAARPRRT